MTPSRCADPRIAEQLLDLAQFGRRQSLARSVQLSSEQSSHLDGCATCRGSLERARRLAATHDSLQPSDAEVSVARARFAQRTLRHRARARWPRLLPRVIVAGLLLGLAAGAAAQIAARRWAASKGPAGAHTPAGRVAGPRAAIAPLLPDRPVEPRVEVAGDSVTGNAATPRDPGSTRVHSHRRGAAPVHARALADAAASEDQTTETSAGGIASWETVAAALRAGDTAAAESALNRLAAKNDVRTRDAARLARAQLWLARGRTVPAREELEDLAATGATPTIRARARDALQARP